MKPTQGKDKAAVLILGTIMAVVLLGKLTDRLVRRITASGDLDGRQLAERGLPLLAVLCACACGLLLARWLACRRSLACRGWLELVPADGFDPSAEAVRRFASQLARTRPGGLLGLLARPAHGVRVLLTIDDDGVVHYLLQHPRRTRGVLDTALAAYDEIQVADPDPALLIAATIRPGSRAARVRLVLARPATQPLADAGLDPDPLEAVASVLGTLQPSRGEGGVLALDILAAGPWQQRRLRRRLLKDATRHEHPQTSLGLPDGGRSSSGPRSVAQLAERRQQSRALDRKLTPGDPLLGVQLLLRISTPSRKRARDVMRSLMGSLDVLAGENHLRAHGLRLGALGFLGSDLPWRRRAFDHRLATGLTRVRRRDLVCASEIAGLLKPPTVNCHAQNVARTGGSIPEPPRGLLTFTGQPGLIPLGRIRERAGERLVGVKTDDTFFSYMAGRSRYGKTQTAIGQFVHLARTGHGGLFLDPHADAIKEIKTYLTDDPAIRERVVEINLADHEGEHPQPAWNLFALEKRTPAEAAARVEAFVDALAASLGWDERNTRALNLATQSAQALVELALRLPKELAPTIFQVPVLLSDEDFLQAAMPFLQSGTADFFAHRFPRLPAEAITAVTNLIDRLHASRPVAALLGSPISSYDARRAMNEQRIVLACPGSGSTRDRLVANLLVYDILHAAKSRASIPAEQRTPFWVFLDELQTYDGPNLPALLEQSAKYGGRAFLFNQNPERLTAPTWNAVSTNRSHLASTTVSSKAARMIAAEWGGDPGPEVLTALERYTYLASVTHGPKTTKPFLVHGVLARDLHAEHHRPELLAELEAAIDKSTKRQPITETLTAIDTHTQRIHDWLTEHTPKPLADDGKEAGQAADSDAGRHLTISPANAKQAST